MQVNSGQQIGKFFLTVYSPQRLPARRMVFVSFDCGMSAPPTLKNELSSTDMDETKPLQKYKLGVTYNMQHSSKAHLTSGKFSQNFRRVFSMSFFSADNTFNFLMFQLMKIVLILHTFRFPGKHNFNHILDVRPRFNARYLLC